MKVYINGPGHMTKMAALPIYGKKTLKTFFSRTRSPMILKLDMYHLGLELYKVYINDEPGLTFTYFMARSNVVTCTFEWGKLLQSNLMEENFAANDYIDLIILLMKKIGPQGVVCPCVGAIYIYITIIFKHLL